jgi:glycerophosphoryl diester phosphodiesterase
VSHVARPDVVAHRGASEDRPEHTLAAYRRAIEIGADALECDVRLTADGHLVCVHDRKVDRTSNGRGLVSTLELTQLEGLDWGSWRRIADQSPDGPGPDAPDVESLDDRSRLLTLRRLLSMLAESGTRVELAIETKHPTRYGGLVERQLVSVLHEFGWAAPPPGGTGRVRVMSFSVLALRRMRQLAPRLPLVLLLDKMHLTHRDGDLPRGVAIAGLGIHVVRQHPDFVRRIRENGNAVHVWTVDDPSDVDLCLSLGVDAIITNRPAFVIDRLARTGSTARPGAAHDPT